MARLSDLAVGFDDEVSRAFSFLLDAGFSLSERLPTRVSFHSTVLQIGIFLGPGSHEVGLEIEPVSGSKTGAASIAPLIAVFDCSAAEAIPISVPVTSNAEMRAKVNELADLFRRHVVLERLSSPQLWSEVTARARELFGKRYPSITPEQLALRFQALWEMRDYKALVRLFDALSDYLSSDEREKLEIAKAELKRANQQG